MSKWLSSVLVIFFYLFWVSVVFFLSFPPSFFLFVRFLDFISLTSYQFQRQMLLPTTLHSWFSYLFQGSSSSSMLSASFLSIEQSLSHLLNNSHTKNSCLEFFLQYNAILHLHSFYYHYLGKEQSSSYLHSHHPQYAALQERNRKMKELQQYMIQFLTVSGNDNESDETRKRNIKEEPIEEAKKRSQMDGIDSKEASIEEKGESLVENRKSKNTSDSQPLSSSSKLITFEQFLMTSSQLNQLFTNNILQSLLSLLPASSPSSYLPLPTTPSTSSTKQSTSNKKENPNQGASQGLTTSSPSASPTSSSLLYQQFIPSSFLYQWNFVQPFQYQLLTIQHYSFQLINISYAFYHHLLFFKNIYFLGKNDFYLSLKELCHFYVYFPTISSSSSASSSSAEAAFLTFFRVLEAVILLFSSLSLSPSSFLFPFPPFFTAS
jgi:hypothetical protein